MAEIDAKTEKGYLFNGNPDRNDNIEKLMYYDPKGGMGPVNTEHEWMNKQADIYKRTPINIMCGVCNESTETVVVEAKITGCSKFCWRPCPCFNCLWILNALVGFSLMAADDNLGMLIGGAALGASCLFIGLFFCNYYECYRSERNNEHYCNNCGSCVAVARTLKFNCFDRNCPSISPKV